ncbi:MAG: class I SAM-dependent methyltransferase [Planctomycetota bacterium]
MTTTIPEYPTQEDVDALEPWLHRIEFPSGARVGGRQGKGGTVPRDKYMRFTEGLDLKGKAVLDIGANAGMGTLCLERQGATVTACDIGKKELRQFAIVKKAFGLRADTHECSVYDVGTLGEFDIVVCSGVVYHVRSPQAALDAAWAACKDVMIVEAAVAHGDQHFMYPNENHLNAEWRWFATLPCLTEMLRHLNGYPDVRLLWGTTVAPRNARPMPAASVEGNPLPCSRVALRVTRA